MREESLLHTFDYQAAQFFERKQDPLKFPGWSVKMSEETLLTGKEQGITMTLSFKREWTYHMMHFYLPSLILCIASMLSLFIHYDLFPARMGLSVTTCLSMITLIMGAK